ncbi:MAG: hypothetical protein EPN39_05530, partial [Chitinophagaceae bacterium]
MRRLLIFFFAFLYFSHSGWAQVAGQQVPVSVPIIPTPLNALLYLPWDYNITSKKYPLIIETPGDGEKGSDVNKLLNNGLPDVIEQGHPPYSVSSSGDTTWFIVLSVQPASGSDFTGYEMNEWWSTLINSYHLRIDTGAVFAAGYSAGGNDGQGLYTFSNGGFSNGWHIRAFIDMSPGVIIYPGGTSQYADSKIWFFHGKTDPVTLDHVVTSYNDLSSAYPAGQSGTDFNLTYYNGGHGGWNTFYTPTWKLSIDSTRFTVSKPVGKSIYDWLMQHAITTSSTKQPPIANAGGNQAITLPVDSVMLDGSASFDSSGTIVSYKWSLQSGPSIYTIVNADSAKTEVKGLDTGTYIFTLTVTDDSG